MSEILLLHIYFFCPLFPYKTKQLVDVLVINLASIKYAKLVTPYLTPKDILITCRFLIQKPDGSARATVSTVRTARGQMVRYLIKNRITEPVGLKDFDLAGYRFIGSRSDDFNYIFIQNWKDA
ncbi:MAG: peroxide stress protein YaaA [Dehalobacterium sp.]